jgi:hypothetical protein
MPASHRIGRGGGTWFPRFSYRHGKKTSSPTSSSVISNDSSVAPISPPFNTVEVSANVRASPVPAREIAHHLSVWVLGVHALQVIDTRSPTDQRCAGRPLYPSSTSAFPSWSYMSVVEMRREHPHQLRSPASRPDAPSGCCVPGVGQCGTSSWWGKRRCPPSNTRLSHMCWTDCDGDDASLGVVHRLHP